MLPFDVRSNLYHEATIGGDYSLSYTAYQYLIKKIRERRVSAFSDFVLGPRKKRGSKSLLFCQRIDITYPDRILDSRGNCPSETVIGCEKNRSDSKGPSATVLKIVRQKCIGTNSFFATLLCTSNQESGSVRQPEGTPSWTVFRKGLKYTACLTPCAAVMVSETLNFQVGYCRASKVNPRNDTSQVINKAVCNGVDIDRYVESILAINMPFE